MQVLTLSGTHLEIGRAFGETCRAQIQEFYELRVKNALGQALAYGGRDVGVETLLRLSAASLDATRDYDHRGYEELQGIAQGANLEITQVLAMNGLTDFRDVLAWQGDLETFGGCTSFVAQRDWTKDGRILCGQTWDLATDNMPFVIGVIRKPSEGPATCTLTTTGCLSLIGLNEAGVAVGTTNLRTTDARRGVNYLSIIHKALSQRDFESAVACVETATRAGAHYYYLTGKGGQATTIECTATQHRRADLRSGYAAHTNHCLVPEFAAQEGQTPQQSSHRRLARINGLLESGRGQLDMARAQSYFADHSDGVDSICRHDYNGISTNGAIVIDPELPQIRACHGLPDHADWVDLLGDAFAKVAG